MAECARNVYTEKGNVANKYKMPQVGDVYLLELSGVDQEQNGIRPCVVISNNLGNRFSPNVIVLPLTTSLKKLNQPTHVLLSAIDAGLKRDSMVLCENPACVSKGRLIKFLTTLRPRQLAEVSRAYLLATGILSNLTVEQLIAVRNQAMSLDAA